MIQEALKGLPQRLVPFAPPAPAGQRALWEGLPAPTRAQLIARGEEYLSFAYPPLSATDYLDFARTGNRVRFETPYFARRRALNALVLAECAENAGRFLDGILNGVFALCEESGWQLPPHNAYVRDAPQLPLPDAAAPVLDLFACETGAQLALIAYLLPQALDGVSPAVRRRIFDEVQRRIVAPYLTRHFWWMGDGGEPMCNWTPWCTQNVLLAVFLTGQPQEICQRVLRKACYSLDCFLKDYGQDGCCEEGALYYRHAGLCLFGALEVMNAVSGNHFAPLWQDEKIRNIARYILHAHVAGDYYINFADCSPKPGPAGVREYLFGKRTGQRELMDFAAADWRRSGQRDLPEEINLFYRLQAAFTAAKISAHAPGPPAPLRDSYYPSTGLFIARDETYCLAVKAGGNGESHNHNDTGSFTLYKRGRPFLIDVGVGSYTKKTFSPRRYEIWTMQSAYHNLPTFSGVQQQDGAAFRARDVRVSSSPREGAMELDIAPAYPKKVRGYRRRAALRRGEGVVVEDAFEGEGEALLSLMLCSPPQVAGEEILVAGAGRIRAKGAGPIAVEAIAVDDPRLLEAWPATLYRVLLPFKTTLRLEIE